MTSLPLRKPSPGTGTSVIPFPIQPYHDPDTLSSDPALAERIPSLQQVTDEVKSVIESFVTEAYFKRWLSLFKTPDDPFDAVYLSRLRPDPVDPALLAKYMTIEDISDEISFDDNFED